MAFWGCEVKPGKATPFVPPPESSKLHLSQACLSTAAKPGSKAALKVKVGEGAALLVCALREGATESAALDLIFDQYTEFSVEGAASIHLTGYFMPEYEMGEEGESDDEEDPAGQILGYDEYGVPVLAGEYDSEEDSDYETEDSEEDEEMEEDSDGDLEPPRRSNVVIEEITDDGEKKQQQQQQQAKQKQQKGGKAADFGDEDVDASDDEEEGSEEEEEGSEEEEEGSEDEEEESEEEEQAAAAAHQHAGQKRKAEQQPAAAKQQAAKQAKQQQQQQQPKQAAAATPAAAEKQQQKQAAAATPATAGKQQQQKAEAPASTAKPKVRKFPNGFEIEDLKMGRPDGKLAKAGKKVMMRYVGKLKSNGKVFDQTKGNATFGFRLGVGEVIKGWDRGVEGMRVGDKRRLTIPPQMAYGSSGVRGAIPPNAWLVFDVELVDVK